MLLFSLKKRQRVVVGQGDKKIVITIVRVGEERVSVGVEAPLEVPVHREVVYQAVYPHDRF